MHERRLYGRVDGHGGEYAVTLFTHAYFLPLVPRGSFWITRDDGGLRTGFPIERHRRSIVATYLRWWGPVVAVVALAAPLVVGLPVAAVAAALVGWSWTWRALRGELPRRRSDWNLCAYNTRCPPALIARDDRQRLHRRLSAHWREHEFERTPEEVARGGPTTAAEALLAYALLALSGASALADRLVLARHEPAGDLRVVEVAADVRDAASTWHRHAAAERDDLHARDWADLLATDEAFAAALAAARRSSAQRDRARKVIAAEQRRARELLTGGVLLAVGAAVFAVAAWVFPAPRDRASCGLVAAALAGAAGVALVRGRQAHQRARAALEQLAAAEAQSTN